MKLDDVGNEAKGAPPARFPGSEESRRATAKLHEMGVSSRSTAH